MPNQLVPGLLDALRALPEVRVWAQAPMAPFTSIGAGGKVAAIVTCGDTDSLVHVLVLAREAGMGPAVLGAGSNLLVADSGCPGLVVKLGDGFNYVEHCGKNAELEVGGGLSLPRLATYAAEAGLSGLEFACGIPGSVGGATAMNAGAHGGQLADVAQQLALATPDGAEWVDADTLTFGYRHCGLPSSSCVTAVRFGLRAADRNEVLALHRANLRARRGSQPRGVRTFGSVFKNPPGDSAGRLLDEAGLKGVTRGGATVSTVHANFIVNVGDTTTTDVLSLMDMMRAAVSRRFGVLLEPEVCLWGTQFPWTQESGPRG